MTIMIGLRRCARHLILSPVLHPSTMSVEQRGQVATGDAVTSGVFRRCVGVSLCLLLVAFPLAALAATRTRLRASALRWAGMGLLTVAFLPSVAFAATKTWDGGGSGNNCSTLANWSSDTKPTAADDVILDGTSTKDLTWDSGCPTGIKTWSQNSGYTGTASFSITNFTLTGGLTLAAGTLTAPSGTLTVRGTVTKTGGTFSHNDGTVLLAGTGAYTLEPGGATFSNLTLDNGLVGYWKLDEGTGNKARDSSGNGNVGTLTSMSTGIGGPSGWSGSTTNKIKFYNPYGLKFDGTDDYVGIPEQAFASSFTTSYWVRFPTFDGNHRTPVGAIGKQAYDYHHLFLSDTLYLGVGGSFVGVSHGTINAGEWYHFATVRDANNVVTFYKNGISLGTGTLGGTTYVNALGRGYVYTNCFMDDVRIYSRALSASEVKALYNGSKSTGSGTYTLGSSLTVAGALSVFAGTLDVSGSNYAVSVAGNVAIHGDLTPRSGTVTLNGSGNQTISGSTVFWNLTRGVSAAANLFFDYTARQSASGTLTLQGTAGNLLSIRSTRSGSGARLLLDGDAGTQSLSYLDVKDSDASAGTLLSCLNCTDSAHNANWEFITPYVNDYGIAPDAINSGGGDVSKSNNYFLSDSLGEPIVGFGFSQNYQLESGYRHSASQNVLSFSCSSTVNLGSVAGTGQKTGSGSCTIVTEETGYSLSWTVSSGSGGVNTGLLINQYNDTIAPFTPTTVNTPDSWSVATADSEWGGRVRSASTDAAAEWGVDGASEKWLSIAASTSRTIATRSTPTPTGGSNEIIQFRSEVGASAFKQTGTYRTTVTLTAVTL